VAGSGGSLNTRRELQSTVTPIDLCEEASTSASPPLRQSGRKRRREPEIIDVDLEGEERIRSRRRMPSGNSSSRRQSSGEVIVLDD